MKTDRDYGMDYAKWLLESGEIIQPEFVDIEEMIIPDKDYVSMRRAGIEHPDDREYWRGYNEYMEKTIQPIPEPPGTG